MDLRLYPSSSPVPSPIPNPPELVLLPVPPEYELNLLALGLELTLDPQEDLIMISVIIIGSKMTVTESLLIYSGRTLRSLLLSLLP